MKRKNDFEANENERKAVSICSLFLESNFVFQVRLQKLR